MYLPNCCGAVSLCSNRFTWTKVLTQDHYTCVQWYNKIWAIYTSFNKSQDSRSTKILMLRFQCNGWKEFRWSKFYRIVIYWHPSTMKALFYHITKAKFNEKIYGRPQFMLGSCSFYTSWKFEQDLITFLTLIAANRFCLGLVMVLVKWTDLSRYSEVYV